MSLRLFKLCHPQTGAPLLTLQDEVRYFAAKHLAKKHRTYLASNAGPAYIVRRGPDHPRGETF